MNPLLALAQRLDDWANRKTDPIVQATVPTPRAEHVWSHCPCCLSFCAPQPCPIVHRTPCDKASCGQWTVTELTS
jgi:hypothetical protein